MKLSVFVALLVLTAIPAAAQTVVPQKTTPPINPAVPCVAGPATSHSTTKDMTVPNGTPSTAAQPPVAGERPTAEATAPCNWPMPSASPLTKEQTKPKT